MASLEEIRNERLKKLHHYESVAQSAYPVTTKRDLTLNEVSESFTKLLKRVKPLTIVGRVMSLRPQGKIIFFHIDDGSAKFQGMLKQGEPKGISDVDFDLFSETVDVGDFVEISGKLFLTKRNEKTLQITSWRMLSKALRQLPEKWHGLQDVEERFRHRYLDTLMNEEIRGRFLKRVKMIEAIREFYIKEGFVEVELPMLQPLAGGATARPFTTHHNAFDIDFYLPVAQELYLKELLAGGFSKVFEMGRRFRNEGIDVTHNPEFTMLESNEAYADARTQMEFIENLLRFVVKKVVGKTAISFDENSIDFKKKFTVVTFYDLLRTHALISNPDTITREEAKNVALRLGIDIAPQESIEKILDNIYKKTARPKLIQPTFIIDYPVAMNPFAKRKEDNPALIDRFQLVVGGVEIVNAFSELNNPIDQKERYLAEDKKKKEGEHEISPSDMEYLEAMEYGMPPNGGIGIGIDRLAMLLTDVKNIREVILFPTLRPKVRE
ncbi:MAG: lysine--tRNA ligase [Minisyncoccia bacterium]